MQDIEPYFNWRHLYMAEEDKQSPFYGQTYSLCLFVAVLTLFYFVSHTFTDPEDPSRAS